MNQLEATGRALAALHLFHSSTLRAALLLLLCATFLSAAPMYYIIGFTITYPPGALDAPPPTGTFTYDSDTGVFSDFVVSLLGNSVDLTAAANTIGGNTPLAFELGVLSQNLINGYGALGPQWSNWYAGPLGFYGFEWRTPATDFLYQDLTAGAPYTPISADPRRFSGTWTTTVAAPEPGTFVLSGFALLAAYALWRRRARRAAARRFNNIAARIAWPRSASWSRHTS